MKIFFVYFAIMFISAILLEERRGYDGYILDKIALCVIFYACIFCIGWELTELLLAKGEMA